MKNLSWVVGALALSLMGCGGAEFADTVEDAEGQVSQAAVTCTETYGQCRVGRCELGPNDRFQLLTRVCCDAAGACTTTTTRICGC
ncbi:MULTISPECIES: hypothetical protein [Myxococcus]|uniref:hypothetical protein n=1 Tax=Myxococcus TaxID=32 RepID=UPI0013D269F8|nr:MULTISPECIES: hypothetical protein [Myxococcus]NVJ28647.1 hypothetical protein [Myxococcus sp. AM011]